MTPERRQAVEKAFEAAIREIIADEVELFEDDDGQALEHFGTPCCAGGRFSYIPATTVEATLDGDAMLGCMVADGGPVDGLIEGLRYTAMAKAAHLDGGEIKVRIEVSPG